MSHNEEIMIYVVSLFLHAEFCFEAVMVYIGIPYSDFVRQLNRAQVLETGSVACTPRF
jgi:hypothetical protein